MRRLLFGLQNHCEACTYLVTALAPGMAQENKTNGMHSRHVACMCLGTPTQALYAMCMSRCGIAFMFYAKSLGLLHMDCWLLQYSRVD